MHVDEVSLYLVKTVSRSLNECTEIIITIVAAANFDDLNRYW